MKKAIFLLSAALVMLPVNAKACSLATGGELVSIISDAGSLLGGSMGGVLGKVNTLCNKVSAMQATMDRALSAIPVCPAGNAACIAANRDAFNAQQAMKSMLSAIATTTANVEAIASSGLSPSVAQSRISAQISSLESSIASYKPVLVSSLKKVGSPPPPATACTVLDVNNDLATNASLETPLPEDTVRDVFRVRVDSYQSCEERVADEVYCCWN